MFQNVKRRIYYVAIFIPCCAIMLGLSGCGGGTNAFNQLSTVPTGIWGAQGFRLDVTDTGATIQTNCGGTGLITLPLVLDSNLHFDVVGTETPGGGVPPPPGVNTTFAIRLAGTTDGHTMTVTVTPVAGGTPITYVLTHGQSPTLLVDCP